MFYLLDRQAQRQRFFSRSRMYGDVDWLNFDEVIAAFRVRIDDWYLEPAKNLATNIHFAFSLMALNCLLIDTLSQFVSGASRSTGRDFVKFVRTELPSPYQIALPNPIRHSDGSSPEKLLNDVPEVIYHGIRCGILHQGHMMPYAGVVPNAPEPVQVFDSGPTRYSDTDLPCPYVVVGPIAFHQDLSDYFGQYLSWLGDRDPANDRRRVTFKKKFSESFGVDISKSTFS